MTIEERFADQRFFSISRSRIGLLFVREDLDHARHHEREYPRCMSDPANVCDDRDPFPCLPVRKAEFGIMPTAVKCAITA